MFATDYLADPRDIEALLVERTILVVDDSDTNLVAIEAALAPLGVAIVLARSGLEALGRLLEQDFALILLDIAMPGMDGFETATMLRTRERSRTIPIIFLTGLTWDPDEIIRAYRLGAVDFLIKPVQPEVLRAKASVFVELRQRTAELHERAAQQRRSDLAAERLESEKREEAAESERNNLLLQAPVATAVMRGPEHVFTLVNPLYARMVGHSNLVGKKYGEAFPHLVGTPMFAILDRVYVTGEPFVATEYEVALDKRGTGTLEPGFFTFNLAPLRDGRGRVYGIMAAAVDITEQVTGRRALERALAGEMEAQRRLTAILDQMPAGVMIAEASGAAAYANKQAQEIFGGPIVSAERSTVTAWHPDGKVYAASELPIVRALHGEVVRGQEVLFKRSDGIAAVVRANAAPILDGAGKVVAAVTAYYDITAEKRLEQDLQRSEERFRKLAESTSDIVWTVGPDGAPNEDWPSWRAFTGQSFEELTGPARALAIHPDDRARALDAWAKTMAERTLLEIEYRLRRHDGVYVPMSVRGTPVYNADGTVREWVGTHVDITARLGLLDSEREARKQADAARQRMALLDSITKELVGNVDASTSAIDQLVQLLIPGLADWCVVYVPGPDNRIEAIAVAHIDPAKATAAKALIANYPIDPEQPWGIAQILRTGTSELAAEVTDEMLVTVAKDPEHLRLMRSAGMTSHLAVPLRSHGQVIGCLALSHAESGRRFTPDDLALAEEIGVRAALAIEQARLNEVTRAARADAEAANRAKDDFLAMLGHELRNPLAPIVTALRLMEQRGHGPDRERSVIERQVKHLTQLVDDLLDVSRITSGKIELRRQRIELAEVVTRAIEIASPLLERRAHDLVSSVAPTGLVLDADPSRLAQVIANLVTNAAKYSDPASQISISALRDGDEVVLTVRDSGIGIAQEMLPRVFDLFTQERQALDRSQGGLGLGLAIVRSLVVLHGGSVVVHSEGRGQGTEVTVRLPALASYAQPPASAAAVSLVAGHGVPRRILVVDDNRDAAEMLAMCLESFGHTVCIAHDGPSALDIMKDQQFDIGLLDIGLPAMDGYELAQRLRADASSKLMRLAALTGYGQASDRARSLAAGFNEHVVKPISFERLQSLISELGEPSG